MSEKKQLVVLGLLEEDDKFAEFAAEDWAGFDEAEDARAWDDHNAEDDFFWTRETWLKMETS